MVQAQTQNLERHFSAAPPEDKPATPPPQDTVTRDVALQLGQVMDLMASVRERLNTMRNTLELPLSGIDLSMNQVSQRKAAPGPASGTTTPPTGGMIPGDAGHSRSQGQGVRTVAGRGRGGGQSGSSGNCPTSAASGVGIGEGGDRLRSMSEGSATVVPSAGASGAVPASVAPGMSGEVSRESVGLDAMARVRSAIAAGRFVSAVERVRSMKSTVRLLKEGEGDVQGSHHPGEDQHNDTVLPS